MQAAVEARAASRATEKTVPVLAPLGESVILRCEQEEYLGDGRIFSYFHRGKFVYVQLWEKWLVWQGHNWSVDINAKQAKEAVDKVAQEYLRIASIFSEQLKDPELSKEDRESLESRKKRMVTRAKRCRKRDRLIVLDFAHTGADPLSIEGTELDADPWLLGCANGVIDLRTCEHRAGKPEDYITKACATEWQGLDADGKPFLDFLHQMLGTPELVGRSPCGSVD